MNLLKKLAFTVATVGVIWNCPAMDLELVAPDRTIGYETFAERIDVFSRTQTSSTANDYVGNSIVSFIGATAKRVCLAILSNGQGNQVAQNEVFKRQCIDTYTEDDIDELLLLGAFCNTLDTDIVKCCKFIFGSVSNMSPIKKIIDEDQFYTTRDFDSVIYGMGLVYSPATSIEKNSKHTIIQPFYSDIVGFSARYCLARGFVDWLYSSPNRQTRLTKELCNTMHNLSIAVHKTEIEFPQDAAYAAVRKLFIETTDEKDDDEDQDIGVEAAVISCSDFPITQFLLSTYNKADNEKIMKFLRQVFGAF